MRGKAGRLHRSRSERATQPEEACGMRAKHNTTQADCFGAHTLPQPAVMPVRTSSDRFCDRMCFCFCFFCYLSAVGASFFFAGGERGGGGGGASGPLAEVILNPSV